MTPSRAHRHRAPSPKPPDHPSRLHDVELVAGSLVLVGAACILVSALISREHVVALESAGVTCASFAHVMARFVGRRV